jgi:hypothetical protein
MDDLEFRNRAFSNPSDDQEDFRAAADAHPARRRLLDELTALEKDLRQAFTAVDIPEGLHHRLHQHAMPAETSLITRLKKRSAYLMAASLVITAGLGLSVAQSRPNAQDLAFHDSLVEHLHHEAPRYAGPTTIQWQQVETVMQAAGAKLQPHADIVALHLTFANHCGFGVESGRGAHIVAQGEHGPISIIFVRNAPVSSDIKLRDQRFKGRIIPMAEGNMAVIGEKQESLEYYEKLLRENFEWSI